MKKKIRKKLKILRARIRGAVRRRKCDFCGSRKIIFKLPADIFFENTKENEKVYVCRFCFMKKKPEWYYKLIEERTEKFEGMRG